MGYKANNSSNRGRERPGELGLHLFQSPRLQLLGSFAWSGFTTVSPGDGMIPRKAEGKMNMLIVCHGKAGDIALKNIYLIKNIYIYDYIYIHEIYIIIYIYILLYMYTYTYIYIHTWSYMIFGRQLTESQKVGLPSQCISNRWEMNCGQQLPLDKLT